MAVRQWVLSLPKRLRYFVHRDAELAGEVLRVFLRAAEPVPEFDFDQTVPF